MTEKLTTELPKYLVLGIEDKDLRSLLKDEEDPTQTVLESLKTCLTWRTEGPPESDDGSEDCVDCGSETESVFRNDSKVYVNALRLVQKIDPAKGAIDPQFTVILLALLTHHFSHGGHLPRDTVTAFARYSILDPSQGKKLVNSFIRGAKYWLELKRWKRSMESLEYISALLEVERHGELCQKLTEARSLEEAPEAEAIELMEKLERLVDGAPSLCFNSLQSQELSWEAEDAQDHARRQRRQLRKKRRNRDIPTKGRRTVGPKKNRLA